MKDTTRLLQDILEAITTIESYAVASQNEFLEDEKTQDAIMFNLIIMGEAANKIPPEFQEIHPEIPWSSIIGTRNVIVHGYDQVKLQIVWDIIQKNLHPLKMTLSELVS
ncbi:MAG: DUF86 domain-containing protein [Chloroflexi bacterium]|nr:DUF86 domain-containing protein [Chloroflexota bacterium]